MKSQLNKNSKSNSKQKIKFDKNGKPIPIIDYPIKKQKPSEIQIINQLQSKAIALQIGISQQQIKSFEWFFDQLYKFKLPSEYIKVLNPDKNCLTYQNKLTNQSFKTHPLLHLIKPFFYSSHSSNRSTFTFSSKQSKLLPYVQQKMMKNCLSLNSKRKEVQKLNLQKDQNGKIVLSKMARIKPKTDHLVSARSYMLKMLIEKVFTKKELLGKGKRAKVLEKMISQKEKLNNIFGINGNKKQKNSIPGANQQQTNSELSNAYNLSLQQTQTIFIQSCEFYFQQYGQFLKSIPNHLLNSLEYKFSTPSTVIENLLMLNITSSQIQLYWFGRLLDCLQIPSNWTKIKTQHKIKYIYEPMKIQFQVHPGYVYIIGIMNKFKGWFNAQNIKNDSQFFHETEQNFQNQILSEQQRIKFYRQNRIMVFYDYFQRFYKVDIYSLMLKQQMKRNKLINQQLQADKKNNKKKKEKIDNLNKANINQLNQYFNNHVNDWLIVQCLINSNLIETKNYQLIEKICEYWNGKVFPKNHFNQSIRQNQNQQEQEQGKQDTKKLDKKQQQQSIQDQQDQNLLQQYFPTVSPFGDITWSSTVNYSLVDNFPYLEEYQKYMNKYLATQNLNINKQHNKQKTKQNLLFVSKELKKQINIQKIFEIISLKQQKQIKEQKQQFQKQIQKSQSYLLLKKLPQQRQNFIKHYINNNINDSRNKKNNHIKQYQINTQSINLSLETKDYFNQVFICPFQLDKGVLSNGIIGQEQQIEQEQVYQLPLWLQIARAKKFQSRINNLLSLNSQQLLQKAKQLLNQFTVKIIKKHQPYRLQQIQNKLRNLQTKQKIKQFLIQITDIQGRQQRKRKQFELQNNKNKQNQDSFFGSDVSMQEVDQIQQQEQKSQEQDNNNSDNDQKNRLLQQQNNQQNQQQDSDLQDQLNQALKNMKFNQSDDNQNTHQPREQLQFLLHFNLNQILKLNKKILQKQQLSHLQLNQLKKLLILKYKEVLKKYKYSSSSIKRQIQNKFNKYNINQKQQKNHIDYQNLKNILKNLILTNWKQIYVPFRMNGNILIGQERNKNNRIMRGKNQFIKYKNNQSTNLQNNIKYTDHKQFNSQLNINPYQNSQQFFYNSNSCQNQNHSLYPTFQIQKIIKQQKQHIQKLKRQKQEQQRLQNLRILKQKQQQQKIRIKLQKQRKKRQQQQQRMRIILQPIKRTKPDISQDRRLRYVKDIEQEGEINFFRQTFMGRMNINRENMRENNVNNNINNNSPTKYIRTKSTSSFSAVSTLNQTPINIKNYQNSNQISKQTIEQQKLQTPQQSHKNYLSLQKQQKQSQLTRSKSFDNQKNVYKTNNTQLKINNQSKSKKTLISKYSGTVSQFYTNISPDNNKHQLSKDLQQDFKIKIFNNKLNLTPYNDSPSLNLNKNQNYNRVCLLNTASNFLPTQSIRRKSQLIVIEARKSLVSKGRGMNTYIKKNY